MKTIRMTGIFYHNPRRADRCLSHESARYGNGTQPASPSNPLPGAGAKNTHAPPVKGSASAAEVGMITVEHVAV